MMRGTPTPTTFGTPRRRREYPAMTLIESVYRPSLSIATHAHELPVCVMVLDGAVTTSSAKSTVTAGPRSLRTVAAGEVHSNRYGPEGARCFLLEIKPEMKQQVGEFSGVLEAPVPPGATARASEILSRMYDEFTHDDDVASLAVHGCLLELVALLRRASAESGSAPVWLARVKELVLAEFRRGITVRELSEVAQVHPVHLARQFRRHLGCSPSEYVRSLRVQWSRRELRRSDAPLSLIAADAGFADQSHFTREFRRIVGVTPARYRGQSRH